MLSTHSSVPITTGPINKMFLQLTVKNQEHQKFKKSRCVVYFFEKEIEETIIPIDLFYCLFAVTHLSKETSNCQRTFILYNNNCIFKLFLFTIFFFLFLKNEAFNIFLTLLCKFYLLFNKNIIQNVAQATTYATNKFTTSWTRTTDGLSPTD